MRTGRVGEAVDRVWPLAALALAMVMLGAAAASGHLFPNANPPGGSPVPTATPSFSHATVVREAGPAGPAHAGTNWVAVIVALTLAATAALAVAALLQWFGRRSRRTAPLLLEPQPPVVEQLPDLRAELLDAARGARTDLLVATDVRDAVIAAYLAFEAAVARNGVARLAHETSGDLLSRTLRSIDVPPGAARQLVALYERVRFGQAASDEAMRTDAEHCLSAITDALAGARR